MSIDLNWETVTGGPDGQALANKIRDFIHTKFQAVPLPRFIKSVKVHDFQFGTIPPEIELKDITDPLPDFYEDNVDSDLASDSDSDDDNVRQSTPQTPDRRGRGTGEPRHAGHGPPYSVFGSPGARSGDLSSPFLRVSTPGIPGGTSNLHYFHPHLASGLSGTQTPLAAVAGAQHLGNVPWLDGHGHSSSMSNLRHFDADGGLDDSPTRRFPPGRRHSRTPSGSSVSLPDASSSNPNLSAPQQAANSLTIPLLREKHSVSTLAPTSADPSRPPTRDRDSAAPTLNWSAEKPNTSPSPNPNSTATATTTASSSSDQQPQSKQQPSQPPQDDQARHSRRSPRLREPRVEDIQAVFRIRYAGDVKLLLTADILLDYPMPSFVGIPVKLSITGLTFDGVGVLAKIRRRVHFCFLSPEDAVAAVGGDDESDGSSGDEAGGGATGRGTGGSRHRRSVSSRQGPLGGGGGTAKFGGLLQEIRVESEIGQRESGKQSLKNVGKVERFVLEQVRRIFEEEFVYPSFWTFLV
ncbi:hypothetical protein VTJ83DRAFT_373 [Remersonia thermophila]|uniref:Mitochondrial distribution and morphology protein 12 n=1 Tax=Remersonia thermophila TaxID=72144 RepID=A0ABR4DL17_9PEZI